MILRAVIFWEAFNIARESAVRCRWLLVIMRDLSGWGWRPQQRPSEDPLLDSRKTSQWWCPDLASTWYALSRDNGQTLIAMASSETASSYRSSLRQKPTWNCRVTNNSIARSDLRSLCHLTAGLRMPCLPAVCCICWYQIVRLCVSAGQEHNECHLLCSQDLMNGVMSAQCFTPPLHSSCCKPCPLSM